MPLAVPAAGRSAELPIAAADEAHNAGRLRFDPGTHGIGLARGEAIGLGAPESAIDMRAKGSPVRKEQRLPATMETSPVQHADSISIPAVPLPTGGSAIWPGLFKTRIRKQVGVRLD